MTLIRFCGGNSEWIVCDGERKIDRLRIHRRKKFWKEVVSSPEIDGGEGEERKGVGESGLGLSC